MLLAFALLEFLIYHNFKGLCSVFAKDYMELLKLLLQTLDIPHFYDVQHYTLIEQQFYLITFN